MSTKFNEYGNFIESLKQSPYRGGEFQQFQSLFDIIFCELEATLDKLQSSDDHHDQARYKGYKSILDEWYDFSKKTNRLKNTSFGYPVNFVKRSFLVDFFRIMESFDVLQNNCGDIHNITDESESLTSKSLEWDIVRLIADNLGLPSQPRLSVLQKSPDSYKSGYWGYVTSGGSESNSWGIRQGFLEYPKGILYFSESAHYSIPKAAENYNYQIIPQNSTYDETIDVEILLKSIKDNWIKSNCPAILVLTFGTTKYGLIDDISKIKTELKNMNIPHYLHIDAAFYGGIPQNQERVPKVALYDDWKYDSICVSLHKYIGYPVVKSVLISAKRPDGKFIDYIAQQDNTVAGSRDIPAFSLRQQVIEMLHYSDSKEYIQNIDIFTKILKNARIEFKQWSDDISEGNTFVFKVDTNVLEYDTICNKWELCEFSDKDNIDYVHVIIFPYQSPKHLQMLVDDLLNIAKPFN